MTTIKKKIGLLVLLILAIIGTMSLFFIQPALAADDLSNIPDQAGLEDFLLQYNMWHPGMNYDSNNAAANMESSYWTQYEANLLCYIMFNVPCVNYDKYPFQNIYEDYGADYIDDIFVAKDPKKKLTFGGRRYDAQKVDWIAKNIFNCSDNDIEIMRKNGEEFLDKYAMGFYFENGFYYFGYPGDFGGLTRWKVEIQDYNKEDSYYYVYYNLNKYFDGSFERTDKYYAKLQYKTIDGKQYWSLYQHSDKEILPESLNFTIGSDTNLFEHNSNVFSTNYSIPDDTLRNKLYDIAKKEAKFLSVLKAVNLDKWEGSCAGIAETIALDWLDVSTDSNYLQNNPIKKYKDFDPKNTYDLSIINYYQILMNYNNTVNASRNYLKWTGEVTEKSRAFLKNMVESAKLLTERNQCMGFAFNYKSGTTWYNTQNHGHVVLVYSVSEDDNNYYLQIYDCNDASKQSRTMTISKDYSVFDFTDHNKTHISNTEQKKGNDTIVTTALKYYDPLIAVIASGENGKKNEGWNWFSFDADDDFTITNAKGEYLTFDGEDYSGTMKHDESMDVLTCNDTEDGSGESKRMICIEASDMYTLNGIDDGVNVAINNDEDFCEAKVTNAETVILNCKNNTVEIEGEKYDYEVALAGEKNQIIILQAKGNAEGDMTISVDDQDQMELSSDKRITVNRLITLDDDENIKREDQRNIGKDIIVTTDAESIIKEKAEEDMDSSVLAIFGNKTTKRIYGENRYDTANSLADALLTAKDIDRFESVIVASGDNYPDALAGGYLAKVKEAPILLVTADQETQIVNKIKRILKSRGTVYLLGGRVSVSENFENRIRNSGFDVERFGGENRYETNIKILKAAGVSNEDLLICSGNGYADSLSASAAGKPILLVGETLTAEQKAYMQNLKPSAVYAIGGEKAVSNDVMNQITTMLGKTFQRVYGEDRYETSAAVAKTFCPNPKAVTLTYALNFPDGLSGSPLAMALNSPILLITDQNYAPSVQYSKSRGVNNALVLGGPGLISDSVAKQFVQ